MSMATWETQMVNEAKVLLKNPKITKKLLMEWKTAPFTAREDETYLHLPESGVYASFLIPEAKTKKK